MPFLELKLQVTLVVRKHLTAAAAAAEDHHELRDTATPWSPILERMEAGHVFMYSSVNCHLLGNL